MDSSVFPFGYRQRGPDAAQELREIQSQVWFVTMSCSLERSENVRSNEWILAIIVLRCYLQRLLKCNLHST